MSCGGVGCEYHASRREGTCGAVYFGQNSDLVYIEPYQLFLLRNICGNILSKLEFYYMLVATAHSGLCHDAGDLLWLKPAGSKETGTSSERDFLFHIMASKRHLRKVTKSGSSGET
jgi:hypothetical protein